MSELELVSSWFTINVCHSRCVLTLVMTYKQRANMLIDTFKCFLQFNSNYLSVYTLQIHLYVTLSSYSFLVYTLRIQYGEINITSKQKI